MKDAVHTILKDHLHVMGKLLEGEFPDQM